MTITPVVVGTNPERTDWLKDCLASIRATSHHRRVLIHDKGGYEIAALRTGLANFRRFLFLHDSCEILSHEFWDIIDHSPPIWMFGGPPMYLAVYDGATLEDAIAHAPEEMTKGSSIVWEGELPQRLSLPTLWPEVHDGTGHMEQRHGRPNLVLENEHLRKWKGSWGQ